MVNSEVDDKDGLLSMVGIDKLGLGLTKMHARDIYLFLNLSI